MCARANTINIGRAGERICQKYLVKLGYKILTVNWYCRWGEIDIIAKNGSELVFIEVKTVTSDKYCKAIQLFSPAKRHKLLRTINIYLLDYPTTFWRLDLVCITKDSLRLWVEHYKNVLAL